MARHFKAKKLYPAIAVIGEGITEHIYFSQLKRYEKLKFTLKPDLPKYSSAKSIVAKAVELIEKEYDHVFCLFDMDEINRDRALREEYAALKREYHGGNITFIENNPCTEFWFLLHYRQTTREFDNYNQLERSLKKYIPDYEKTEKYLVSKDIYHHLKPGQETAKDNAQISVRDATEHSSKSEVHLILDYLRI